MDLLTKQCLIVDTRLNVEKVGNFLKWIEEMPCYRLVFSDLTIAVDLIKSLSSKLDNDYLCQ